MKRIRVVVADDHRLFIQGIRASLDLAEDIQVVGVADSGQKLLSLVPEVRPHLVLLDVAMPQLDGLACLDVLSTRHPTVKVAILSGVSDQNTIQDALRRGACAYILKTVNPDDLPAVIRQVIHGTVFQTFEPAAPTARENGAAADLTDRELALLQALARGLSNEAIAKELWIARQTVKFHLRNIYRKLGVANRTEAVSYAFQNGLTERETTVPS